MLFICVQEPSSDARCSVRFPVSRRFFKRHGDLYARQPGSVHLHKKTNVYVCCMLLSRDRSVSKVLGVAVNATRKSRAQSGRDAGHRVLAQSCT